MVEDSVVQFEVFGKAWFAGLEHQWTSGPHDVREDWVLDLPLDAMLHDLAVEYLTDIHIQVVPIDADGRRSSPRRMPKLFALWPGGEEGEVVVADRAGVEELAAATPHGLTDLVDVDDDSIVRVLAPIGADYSPPAGEPTDEPTTTRTVPVDDQTSLGVH